MQQEQKKKEREGASVQPLNLVMGGRLNYFHSPIWQLSQNEVHGGGCSVPLLAAALDMR